MAKKNKLPENLYVAFVVQPNGHTTDGDFSVGDLKFALSEAKWFREDIGSMSEEDDRVFVGKITITHEARMSSVVVEPV